MKFKNISIPKKYIITGDYIDEIDFIKKLEAQILKGAQLIQIRAKNISYDEFIYLSTIALEVRNRFSMVKIILNSRPEIINLIDADGIHLTSVNLMQLEERPILKNKLLSAACHNVEELERAKQLNVDFVTLSPVLPTNTHPEAKTLGWEKFSLLSKDYPIPVFALGGMNEQSLEIAQLHGAYGLASISWWKNS